MLVLFLVLVIVLVRMTVLFFLMVVMVFMVMSMMFVVVMFIMLVIFVRVLMGKVNVEFDSFDGGFVSAGNVEMIALKLELFQFVLQFVRIDTQIKQRADEHIAANPAEYVQIQRLPFRTLVRLVLAARSRFSDSRLHLFAAPPWASSLIWLAA